MEKDGSGEGIIALILNFSYFLSEISGFGINR
jgi:hypothetical protein